MSRAMIRNEFDSSDEEQDFHSNVQAPDVFKIDWFKLQSIEGSVGELAVSALPGCRFRSVWRSLTEDLDAIANTGISDVFVLLTAGELVKYRVPNLLTRYKNLGIEVHHWPIYDGGIPEIEDLLHLIEEFKLILQCGSRGLIHCYGGLGRACFVAACLQLELDNNLQPAEVIDSLRLLRGPGAVQTVKQYNFIFDYRDIRDSYLMKSSSPRTLSR